MKIMAITMAFMQHSLFHINWLTNFGTDICAAIGWLGCPTTYLSLCHQQYQSHLIGIALCAVLQAFKESTKRTVLGCPCTATLQRYPELIYEPTVHAPLFNIRTSLRPQKAVRVWSMHLYMCMHIIVSYILTYMPTYKHTGKCTYTCSAAHIHNSAANNCC
jgi:hypothetical protein